MSEVGQPNVGSELNSNTSTPDQDLAPYSAFKNPSGERPNSSSPRRLKLRFGNKPSDPVLTGKPISGVDGTDLKIELVDENTNLIVKTGPESSGSVEITDLRADTKSDEKEGNTSLLKGCRYLNLNEGLGLVGKIYFPNRSKWTNKCRYMLMARFVDAFDGISVTDAKSKVFTLKDTRLKRNEKHHPPTLSDEVLCLDNIGKKCVERLKHENIITVKNLLTEHFKNHQRLKVILKMPEKKLNVTIAHALTCEELEDKYIYYIPSSQQQMGIVLNVVGRLFGLKSSCQFAPIETLSETQKENAQELVVSALEHWGDVVRYNEHSLFSCHSGLVSPDCSNDASLDNCEHDDVQPIAASEDITPLNATFSLLSCCGNANVTLDNPSCEPCLDPFDEREREISYLEETFQVCSEYILEAVGFEEREMASFAGTSQKCKACDKTVYLADQLTADTKVFHKACFRCHHCKGTLKLSNYCSFEGVLYCKPHFDQLFKMTGSLDKSFEGAPKVARLDKLQIR